MSPAPYQDWSRYSNPSADAITHVTTSTGNPFSGPISDCSQWVNVIVDFFNNDAGVYLLVVVQFTEFVGGGIQLQQTKMVVGPNQEARFTRPVLGRQVQVTYTVLVGAQVNGASYTVLGTSGAPSKYDSAAARTSLFDDTTAYGAGGVQTLTEKYWYEGPAQVALFTNNNTAAWVEFRYFDPVDNAFHDFAIVQALSWPNAIPHTIHFPPATVQAFVDNQGAAQTVAVHVLPISTGAGTT